MRAQEGLDSDDIFAGETTMANPMPILKVRYISCSGIWPLSWISSNILGMGQDAFVNAAKHNPFGKTLVNFSYQAPPLSCAPCL